MEASNVTARRITQEIDSKDNKARIDRMFEWILNTNANEDEQAAIQAFLIQTETRFISDKVEEPELRHWQSFVMPCSLRVGFNSWSDF